MTKRKTYRCGDEIEVQISPFGRFELHDGVPGHRGVVQVVDNAAVDDMVAAFTDPVLVDVDHRSTRADAPNSEAAAWVTNLRKDPARGLVGTCRLTDLGAEAVTTGRYRFLSPVWGICRDGRPCVLRSVSLTNTPNIPVAEVANAKSPLGDGSPAGTPLHLLAKPLHFDPRDPDAEADGSGADAPEGRFSKDLNNPEKERIGDNPRHQEERSPEMDEIKNALGLGPDATDADVLAAVKALQDEVNALKEEKTEAKAERFAAENAAKGFDHETLKAAYKAAPEAVTAVVANMKAPPPPKAPPRTPVCVGRNAVAPDMKPGRAREGLDACKTPAERCSYVMRHAAELAADA